MAELSGKSGKIEYAGGMVEGFNSWSLDVNVDMHDVTTFTTGTLQWRNFIAGISSWSGSIEGLFTTTSTGLTNLRTNALTPTTGQFVGYMDKSGGENLRGSVLIQTMGHNVDIDGTVDVAFSFQGTGALTYSTAT